METASRPSVISHPGDFPYFRKIWKNVVIALLGASFIPLVLIGGGMYYYTASVIKGQAMETLRTEVIHHKDAIDRFLLERIMDLKILSQNLSLEHLIRPGALEHVFDSLQKALPCFVDLGIIDDQGRHLAYVGPFELTTKNYKDADWFKAIREKDTYISDLFLGFRNVPHFIMAVKRPQPEGYWILRATVDSFYFDKMVSGIQRGERGDAFLVNAAGVFQTTPHRHGELMGPSGFQNVRPFPGLREIEQNGIFQVMVWLEQAPWMCVVQMARSEIFGELNQVRNIGIFVFVLGGILIVLTVLLTTNYLIGRLEFKRKSIRALDQQLQYTSRMVSAMQLSPGFFLKMKDTLGEIGIQCRRILDHSDTHITETNVREEISKCIQDIRSRLFRCRKSIDTFLNAILPVEPMILEIDLNELLDNLLELFEGSLHVVRIRLNRIYEQPAPRLRSDPDRLRQVFQNLLFNAVTAIGRAGDIAIRTRVSGDRVQVLITDSGPGIPEEHLDKLFAPHYTTRPEGMGLGLSICRNILKKLGGSISVQNEPDGGASFIVELPVRYTGSDA